MQGHGALLEVQADGRKGRQRIAAQHGQQVELNRVSVNKKAANRLSLNNWGHIEEV
jgi:hypothetical protein